MLLTLTCCSKYKVRMARMLHGPPLHWHKGLHFKCISQRAPGPCHHLLGCPSVQHLLPVTAASIATDGSEYRFSAYTAASVSYAQAADGCSPNPSSVCCSHASTTVNSCRCSAAGLRCRSCHARSILASHRACRRRLAQGASATPQGPVSKSQQGRQGDVWSLSSSGAEDGTPKKEAWAHVAIT